MAATRADDLSPQLNGDLDRVTRCRLKAEAYRTIADAARTRAARESFLELAGIADAMADEAQARIDAPRGWTTSKM
jgi:hypothetical protein